MAKLTAKTADKYELYESAVQCVEADIDFVERIYKKRRGKKPRLLKEDFCGTASAAVEFVRRHQDNRAIAVDLDKKVLSWGRRHRLSKLGERAFHVALQHANVLDIREPKVDVLLAMNFSYFIFKTRAALLEYFSAAKKSLRSDGLFFLDAYGGSDAQVMLEEPREFEGFTYIWDQAKVNPITSEVVNYIHFTFPDGTGLRNAFRYDWRLWTLREITEALLEVGFATADVYWEGWDEDAEEGDGIFRKTRSAENSPGWVAYIVADTKA